MKQLLIVAHGSRRESSNDEIRMLAENVAVHLRLTVDDIRVAFLEFASPSIKEALDRCFNQGAKEVVVLPYFLAGGNHVISDIPRETLIGSIKWPDKKITILPHIGSLDAMANLVADSYQSQH